MANNIALAKKYLNMLDEVYKNGMLTSVLDADETLIKEGKNVGEFSIAKIDMDGLGDFSRSTGYAEGNVNLTWETVKADKERSQKLKVDRLDNIESMDIAFGKLGGEFVRTKVIPETDAARISKIAGTTGVAKVKETLTTGEEVLKSLQSKSADLDEKEVPMEDRILFITPTCKMLIDSVDTYKSKSVFERFMTIIVIPQSRMYTAITLNDGTSNYGYKKADDAGFINFMIVSKSAVISSKDIFLKVFSADEDMISDSNSFLYREYNLYAYVYENKINGITYSYNEPTA